MPGKAKKSALDVDYLKTATSGNLASSIFMTKAYDEEQRLLQEQQPQQIAIESLLDNPYQPRMSVDEQSLQQLSETIASQGFQGVLVARPHPQQPGAYQITAGHRRRDAAHRAGLKTLPVIVHPWSDQDMATLAATENIQREDLSPLEEGRLFQLMIDEMGLTQVEVASAVKKDRGYVRNRLRLAKAPEDIQAFASTKTDSMRAVIYLLDIEDPAERAPIIEQLLKRTLTTEDLPAYIEELKRRKLAPSQPSVEGSLPQEELRPIRVTGTTGIRSDQSEMSSAVEKSELHPTAQSEEEPDATTSLRIRHSKLKTMLRYLKTYQKSLQEQGALTGEECEMLQQIIVIAQTLISG